MIEKEFLSGCIRHSKQSNQKGNTFIICGKVFFVTKSDGNVIALYVAKTFDIGFAKPTRTVIWLLNLIICLNVSSVREVFTLEGTR